MVCLLFGSMVCLLSGFLAFLLMGSFASGLASLAIGGLASIAMFPTSTHTPYKRTIQSLRISPVFIHVDMVGVQT